MEDPSKDQSSAPVNTVRSSSKLRYPLRSAAKSKEEKTPVAELPNSSASRRFAASRMCLRLTSASVSQDTAAISSGTSTMGKPVSNVSKSVSVLELSGKDKSAKPPRRLSVPKPIGNVTPISEARVKKSVNNQGKSDTPVSDVSRSSNRKKFSVLSSASYWLSQIKLSESAAKHSISLGFFKLALEAQCEPLQRMREELKSYASRHNFVELGETVKELFEGYNILESFEQLQVSDICSQVPEEGTRSSDDDVHSSTSVSGTRKLEPKSLNIGTVQASTTKESAKKNTTEKNNPRATTLNKNSAKSSSVSEAAGRIVQKKSQKPNKPEANKEKDKIKTQGKKSSPEEGLVNSSPEEETVQENKENMDAPQMEEISSTDV